MILIEFFKSVKEFINCRIFFHKFIKKKKIAVVGNASNILKKKDAKNIDNFPIVIRFNAPELLKYGKYVGSKTSIQVINEKVFLKKKVRYKKIDYKKLFNIKCLFIIFISKKKFLKINNKTEKPNFFFIIDENIDIFLKFLIFIRLGLFTFKKKNFTSGLRILLILYFNNLNFRSYGFDKFKSSKNYTYYDNNRLFNKENKHNLKFENKILNKINTQIGE